MSSSAKHSEGKPLSLIWLRRDLRLHDHAALAEAAKAKSPAQPVFIFDTEILKRFKLKADRRLTLIAQTLCRLHEQLLEKDSGLLVFHGKAEDIVPRLCSTLECDTLIAAEDFEPATRKRDENVAKILGGQTKFLRVLDHLLISPRDLLKGNGTPYKVFTPYSRAWRKLAKSKPDFTDEASLKGLKAADYNNLHAKARAGGFKPVDISKGSEALLKAIGYEPASHDWPVMQAHKRLHNFASNRMKAYKTQRDFMAEDGTSRLSPYLRFGLLSIRECASVAFDLEAHGNSGASTWINELIWRDFYAMILYHFPDTQEQEMRPQYRALKWSYDKKIFRQFVEGKTGYPIIDAGMRELLTTGYMHNRSRMIVASFMTKDLLLDWRMGEEHFAQYLMDYELSSNVGGWQWASSTGTDAQPYFRVFNPALQSRRFDPRGDYIRKFVPELKDMDAKTIHEPWASAKPEGYPAPIVDHSEARDKAIAAFKASAK